MSRDSSYTYIHFTHPRNAELFEDFCRDRLPDDDIFVPQQHQPVNPEDEDDIVPDQHAAFGITRVTQAKKEPAWKDFGLMELMTKGPVNATSAGENSVGAGSAAAGANPSVAKMGPVSGGAGRPATGSRRLPR